MLFPYVNGLHQSAQLSLSAVIIVEYLISTVPLLLVDKVTLI